MSAARARGLLTREDAELGAAVDALGEWIASIRNQLADTHPGEDATEAEAVLALAVVRTVAMYLLDQGAPEPVPAD